MEDTALVLAKLVLVGAFAPHAKRVVINGKRTTFQVFGAKTIGLVVNAVRPLISSRMN